jgi:two-component system, response regulator
VSTILLVEDNIDDEQLTLRALKKNRIANEIQVARSGEEAVEKLLGPQAGPLPQLMLLDLNLPKMNGLDVLRRVRAEARTKLLPVVVLTTSKQEQDIVSSYTLGANAYVRKPVDFAQFTQAVQTLGLFWLVLNELPGSPAR